MLYSRKQLAQLQQSCDADLWRAECKLGAFRTQHPRGNREGRAVNELTNYAFTMGSFLTLANLQGLTKQWVPTVVDRDSLKTMGIM